MVIEPEPVVSSPATSRSRVVPSGSARADQTGSTRVEHGRNVFEGGVGKDTVDYDGKASDYMVMRNADGSCSVSSAAYGTDTLKDIEQLHFLGDNTTVDPASIVHTM